MLNELLNQPLLSDQDILQIPQPMRDTYICRKCNNGSCEDAISFYRHESLLIVVRSGNYLLLPYFARIASTENIYSGMIECVLSCKLDVLHYLYELCEVHLPADRLPRIFFHFSPEYVSQVLREVEVPDSSLAYLVYRLAANGHAIPSEISQAFTRKYEKPPSEVNSVLPLTPRSQEKGEVLFTITDMRLVKPYPVRDITDGLDTLHLLGLTDELAHYANEYGIPTSEYGLSLRQH